jgi:hypothetical protein
MVSGFAHVALYVALSRARRLSDLILFGIDEFLEHGLGFHLNRLIEEMDNAFAGRMSSD